MKRYTLLILCYFFVITALAQTDQSAPYTPSPRVIPSDEKPPLKDRIFLGGNLGLQFGDVTYIYIAPIIGYKITPKLGAGGGPVYSYTKQKISSSYTYTSNTYGGRLFGQYQLFDKVGLYTEYESIRTDVYDAFNDQLKRDNINSLFVGGGYVAPIGGNSAFSIMALWNLLEDPYNYYTNPVIRVGFNVGL
jgi:hypothetical protein